MSNNRHRRSRLCGLAIGSLALGAHAAPATEDLTEMSMQQLLDVEVVSVSKYAQTLADAPAAATVLRQSDIRQFGYRTLADILKGLRGFYVSGDRQYSYLGVRGFSPPGDYNTRVLVLVDGYRINDNIYDTGAIGGEFGLDVDLIDRVEVVRGPGSSVYGSNALFGVINVITRRGRDLNGGEASVAAASNDGREGRLSWGKRLESGLEVMVSASGLRNDGPTLNFPEFSATNGGVTSHTDFEHRRQFLTKLEYGAWSLTLMDSRRDKGVPTGAFGTDFNDRGNHIIDGQTSANLGYYGVLDSGAEVTGRLYAGNYGYKGYYVYGGTVNRDVSEGAWVGGEGRIVKALGDHKLVYGAEYQRNQRQNQSNFDANPLAYYLDDRRRSERYGIFAQDDYSLARRWVLSVGLRYDHASSVKSGGNVSPRLGLIHHLDDGAVAKLLYGSAYRTPNVYERYYQYPGQQLSNPALASERIKTYEAIWEKDVGPGFHLVGSAYYYRIRDWIVFQPQTDPFGTTVYRYENQSPVSAKGLEFEADRQWEGGVRTRASYSAQFAPERSNGGINQAPRHLLKTSLSTPLWSPAWRTGVEYQYMSSRTTASGRVGGYGLANATLLYVPQPRNFEVALSFYNLFDRRYADPASDPGLPNRESLVQDGRAWRLKLTVPF
ncbi:MAG TPA: TonB-dependent receptor [Rhodocyclaceae bacterium]|nr:TonB-dependent receptor [Rhodocyclaceae bacterium]